MNDFEMVRVTTGMVERLLAEEPKRVMLVGLERHDDGTVELMFRTPDDRGVVGDADALARAVSASLTHGEDSPLADALKAYLVKHPWRDL